MYVNFQLMNTFEIEIFYTSCQCGHEHTILKKKKPKKNEILKKINELWIWIIWKYKI